MEMTAAPDYERGLTFEKVWAALKETDRIVKESAGQQEKLKRTMEEVAERQKETERAMKEAAEQQKETERAMKKAAEQRELTDKQFGRLNNRFGEMIEYMVVPCLIGQFRKWGFTFTTVHQNTVIEDPAHDFYTEIDAFLENGDKAMLVEIKSKPTIDHIKEHLERMEKMRIFADGRGDSRKYLGAVAGIIFNQNERRFALKCGLYVIEPSGDSFTVTAPEGEYQPREW